MLLRLVGIALVLVAATIGWLILGATIGVRTGASDFAQREQLAAIWGAEQAQPAPGFTYVTDHVDKKGRQVVESRAAEPASSRVDVGLQLDPRQKGLLWYNTYAVRFTATYRVVNPGPAGQLEVAFHFPSDNATYDDFTLDVDGVRVPATSASGTIDALARVPRGRTSTVTVAYRSHGIGIWSYRFGDGVVAVRDFRLVMRTNFRAIDFPPRTLAPTTERQTPDGCS